MYIHLEGINFASSIFDSNDISTIRGGSMLNEALPQAVLNKVSLEVLQDGGSRLLARFNDSEKPRVEAAVSAVLNDASFKHLSATWGYGDTAEQARAQAHWRAAQLWSVPPVDDADADTACPVDRVRIAATPEIGKDGKTKRFVSSAVAVRRKIARDKRPGLFDAVDFGPPQSIEDIVQLPAHKLEIPPVVRGKVAVICADGIGGSALKARLGPEQMSCFMKAFHKRLADAICSWALDEGLVSNILEKPFARMDVFFWGGDDMRFVVPAHAAMSFVRVLLSVAESETDFGADAPVPSFPHRVGVVLAQYKVPVRQLNALSESLEAAARNSPVKGQSAVCIAAFESASLPYDDIREYWRALYGVGHKDALEVFSLKEFRDFDALCGDVSNEEGEEEGHRPFLTTTQVNRILWAIGGPQRQLIPDEKVKDDRASRLLIDHFERVHGGSIEAVTRLRGLQNRRSMPLLLAHIAQFKPYFDAARKERVA